MTHDTPLGDLILAILLQVQAEPEAFAHAAAQRGITVEQLTAAAIAGAVQERLDGQAAPRRPRQRRRP